MTSVRLHDPEPSSTPSPVLAGAWGAGLSGLLVAALTLRLNPHLEGAWLDRLVLATWMALGYGVLGALLGVATTVALRVVARVRQTLALPLRRVASDLLAFSPLFYFLMLPDVGLAGTLLTRALFGLGFGGRSLFLLAIVAAASALGWALRGLESRAAIRGADAGRLRARRAVAVAVPTLGLALALALPSAAGSAAELDGTEPVAPELPDPATRSGVPVLLLCIDGADLQVLEPMMDRGELPTFSHLREEGVWGPLETFYPSLSPVIWTTMVTGRAPEDHGIHGFLVHRLPGMSRPIHRFPVHSGLNFRLFPLLERVRGMPTLRFPYTSNMRRVPALWNVVGEHDPVGIYHWRVTWPAEPVPGFNLTEGVALLGGSPGAVVQLEDPAIHPPELAAGVPHPETAPVVAPYVTSLDGLDERDERLKAIRGSQERATIEQLLYLVDRYRPMLTVASFYPVDGFNHRFGRDRRDGGRFEPAIEERYRFVDARLGELISRLDRPSNVIVVSDHGYDYQLDHHTHAPPGVLFAIGPDFRRGARVELSVYDVAPLVLELLGYPPATDMPAAGRRAYLEAFAPESLAAKGLPAIKSYGRTAASDRAPRASPQREETMEELRALGYVD
ncbi:MAG TPA: alkaline phosphatase family protein [Thermoanaerobaculia bacterium]|nr:alkaline phosphatase family protein [Thermoanaerobaculia bacterium]